MKLKLVFSGGSEVLFNDKREHDVEVPNQTDVKSLLDWILEHLIEDKKRAPLLIVDGNVRPGILVLVNDVDYEISGGLNTSLKDGDEVTFISTLHGG
ncbi:Ubiquitin-related modifier 1-like protein [Aphelenchoides bicaudatus]|nr:Ubiquitin-related modifier 1-like protein [Aphelenchoides bicaudatus]